MEHFRCRPEEDNHRVITGGDQAATTTFGVEAETDVDRVVAVEGVEVRALLAGSAAGMIEDTTTEEVMTEGAVVVTIVLVAIEVVAVDGEEDSQRRRNCMELFPTLQDPALLKVGSHEVNHRCVSFLCDIRRDLARCIDHFYTHLFLILLQNGGCFCECMTLCITMCIVEM